MAQTLKVNANNPAFSLPNLQILYKSIDIYYNNNTNIQIDEVRQTNKFRWLSYVPSPGYSPFTGGFTFSMNLSGPLNEVRNNHTTKAKITAIQLTNQAAANDLKNSIYTDYQRIKNSISEYTQRALLDSLNNQAFGLSQKKYNDSELTPSEFLTIMKQHEEYRLNRIKEQNAIHEAINNLLYKAKMPVASNNEHLISHP